MKVKVKVTQSRPALCDPMDCPWNSPGQNTGVGSLSLLQGIFPTQGLNPGLLHCRQVLYQLSHREVQELNKTLPKIWNHPWSTECYLLLWLLNLKNVLHTLKHHDNQVIMWPIKQVICLSVSHTYNRIALKFSSQLFDHGFEEKG